MGPGKRDVYLGYGPMDPVRSILLLLRPWMGYDYIVIQVVCWVELSEQRRLYPIFFTNMNPKKWDTTVWYRVTRNPQEFRGLMGCQLDPHICGVTFFVFYRRPVVMCFIIELL